MVKRQSRGDYHGGSTVLSKSGWGFSKSPKSMKKKQLERLRQKRAQAEAIYAEMDASKKGNSDADRT